MDDSITYLFESTEQLLLELRDRLVLPENPGLAQLDSTLEQFVSFCASHHKEQLQTLQALESACDKLLLSSDLFSFHSERMCDNIIKELQKGTNSDRKLIFHSILLFHGRKDTKFLRSDKRLQPLLPLLIDSILVYPNPGTQETYPGTNASGLPWPWGVGVPILLLYEVCRVRRLPYAKLEIFTASFIDRLFDLVEQTRDVEDETFNYSVIKLIVALNEQFMIALLPAKIPNKHKDVADDNRIVTALMCRLGSSRTFSQNLIFMLNRAGRSSEDLCMQLLVLKLLYMLFTTQETSEYFYTNDLCVLVDVFLREVVDLDEDSESLRHIYLRVLHPLLTRTQLRSTPYKRLDIKLALKSLIGNAKIRDINPTTKRLVQRCLGADWCVQLPETEPISSTPVAELTQEDAQKSATKQDNHLLCPKQQPIKSAKSLENLRLPTGNQRGNVIRKASTDSSNSLPNVAIASSRSSRHNRPDTTPPTQDRPLHPIRSESMGMYEITVPRTILSEPDPDSLSVPPRSIPSPSGRRSAPPVPPPVKRRKPPAIPTPRRRLSGMNGGEKSMTTTGAAITSSPLSQNF